MRGIPLATLNLQELILDFIKLMKNSIEKVVLRN